MNEVILLTKVLLKGSKSNTRKTNTKPVSKFFTFLTFLFVYVYLAGIISYLAYQAISSLIILNEQEIFLNICFIGIFGFSIFQAIFTSLNVLFFSKDIEALLPLPLKPYKIIMAKFNCLVVSQYLMYFVVVLPILVVYGYLLNMGVSYYMYSLLILLTFPIIPVAIVSFLLTIIMKFTNIIKNKETVQYITAFISVIIIFLVQFTFGTGSQDITNEELAEKLMEINISVEEYFSFLPNVKTAILTLNNYNNINGIKNFSIFILQSLVVYVVISLVMAKFYVKTVTSIMNKGTKFNKRKVLKGDYKKNKIGISYVVKELKTLIRNPIFFMQCVIPPFLFPLVFLVPSMIALIKPENGSGVFIEYLSSYVNTSIGLITAIEILGLLYIFNFTTITSISRDGSDAKVMKYLPINLAKQLTYKSIIGILLNIIPIVYMIVILSVGLKADVLTLIYFAILAFLINVFNNFLVIIVDLKNPKTDWMTEYAVVKQNLNMFYQMLIIVTEMGLLFFALKIKSLNICFIVLSVIFILLTIFVKKYINQNKLKLFEKIY